MVPWVREELKTADLKDKRLNDRLGEVLSQLAAQPTASIPAACGGHAEMAAAYRLFDNDKASWERILEPHRDATRHRLRAQPVVVLVQDTTDVELTRPGQQVAGTGPLHGASRRGALLHLLHAFTPDGTPLGTLAAKTWVRDEETLASAPQRRVRRRHAAVEAKESYRWVESLRQARAEAARLPGASVVCVADSEADLYELLMEGQAQPHAADWIVRACQNRAVCPGTIGPSAASLRDALATQPRLLTHTVTVRGRTAKVACNHRVREQARIERSTEVEVRAACVTLRPPWRAGRRLPPLSVHVVWVRELAPPEGEAPVEWLLLTSLPIERVDQVRCVVQYYCTRWMVEVFFRTLKTGCRVQERRFEHLDRLARCLALYLIVTWRTLYVCRLGRECPDLSCEAVFEPAEWKAVYRVVRGRTPPAQPPHLGEMVRLVAQLGGYVSRRRPDTPGPQTVWLGLTRMHDFALCWKLFGPDAQVKSQLV